MSIQREQILACACDLYLKGGLEGVSMRRLAREVGVTAPAIYRHFEGKEDVLLGVVGEAYKTLAQYLHRA
ncbi:MAG: TetR family transcriptional regulator, partial [Gemmatimonadetes bacterium]|nr:TetR/AcrR family transcriptional regulator [Gemmatimonadota bacterium]NIR76863.1 TetR/AcrR family transcriptional regulator [Gemmatimonadota bacterium]NIT85385.1 TetR/AcrR family transcriptional regulator [Gemmatimonadota bacterium]NIU29203.1 TetR/AcrR family transcriptional regulator [Gemmatimonadota bacterium]NIU34300.1 TetR family transcriptional regulator [Gemmatimonadota bacterium]